MTIAHRPSASGAKDKFRHFQSWRKTNMMYVHDILLKMLKTLLAGSDCKNHVNTEATLSMPSDLDLHCLIKQVTKCQTIYV